MSAVAWTLLLASVRLWALLRVQVALRALIGASWQAIAGALAIAFAGLALLAGAHAEPPPSWPDALALVLLELLLGSVIGMLASLPGWALCGAAALADEELCGAGTPASLTALLLAGSLASALALGLHRPLLAGLLDTFTLLPPGRPLAWIDVSERGAALVVPLLVHATTLALALATPVLLTRLIVTIGLGALGRGSELDALLLGALVPGLRFVAALLALAAAWTAYPGAWAAGLG